MKFIHTADLHLDSKMESNLNTEKAMLRRTELLDTFERMVSYAAENNVRAILIAGDLFDKLHIRKTAKKRVLEQIASNPEIDFLYLQGNHDKTDFLAELEILPENLKTFSEDEWVSYEYGDVVISGRELTKDNSKTIATNLILDQARTNIVMLHGQESNYEGPDHTEIINLSEFKNKNIDYMALGHIHSYKKERLDDRGEYCYSGCLEGRGFDECGDKGFVLINVNDEGIESTFIPFSKRRLHEIHTQITPEMSMLDIINAVDEQVKNIPSLDMIKIVLEGHTDMDFDMDTDRLDRAFDTRYFFEKVYDRTQPEIDFDSFALDPSLKGEFVRLMQNEDIEESERLAILALGMKAIMGEELEEA